MSQVLAYLQGQYNVLLIAILFVFFLQNRLLLPLQLMFIFVLGTTIPYLFLFLSSIKKYYIFVGLGTTKKLYRRSIVWEGERKNGLVLCMCAYYCVSSIVISVVWQCHKFCELYC